MPVTTKPDKMAMMGNGSAEKDEPLIYARNNVMTEPTKAEIEALWRSMNFIAGFQKKGNCSGLLSGNADDAD
jgi:hypothetical protein